MMRIILRALNAPALILVVAIGLALQSTLFRSYPFLYLQPDVVLLAVVWCGLRRGFTEGGILALLFAEMAEIHSAAPQGTFLVTYMAVYLLTRLSARLFVLPGLAALVILTMAASVFWKLSSLGVVHFLGSSGNQWKHTLVLLFPGAVIEGVAAIWVYRWLDRFDWVTYKNARARQILEDELQLDGEGL